MKERPILFSGNMVREILAGRKTQTRRVIKLNLNDEGHYLHAGNHDLAHKQIVEFREQNGRWFGLSGYTTLAYSNCPYGNVGDRLWVRETHLNWWKKNPDNPNGKRIFSHVAAYKADGYKLEAGEKWIPSIHMLRDASRIMLGITGVRAERLQDISEKDAIAEGVSADMDITFQSGDDTARGMYGELWESINGAGSWDANPWVWVIEFKKV